MPQPFRLAFILAIAVSIAVGSTPTRAAADGAARFGLQPVVYNTDVPASNSYFVFDAQAGATVASTVRVINTGNARGTVRLYGVDATTGQTSGTVFLDRAVPQKKAGTWITLDSTELTLDAGQSSVVPFRVVVPADAKPGQHVAGIVAEDTMLHENKAASTAPNAAGFQVNIKNLTILAVQVSLAGPVTERVTVSGVTTGGSGGYQTLLLGLSNEGTEMVKPSGMLTVTNAQGQEVQRIPLKLDTFLPDTAIQYPVPVQHQALGAGQYHAKVDLTYGTSGVTNYEGDFNITPTQVAQIFPSAVALAPPPGAATAAPAVPTTSAATVQAQWPLFAGGGALLVLILVVGVFLGRRGHPGNLVK